MILDPALKLMLEMAYNAGCCRGMIDEAKMTAESLLKESIDPNSEIGKVLSKLEEKVKPNIDQIKQWGISTES